MIRYIAAKIYNIDATETLGSTYEKLVADVVARFYRLKNDDVYFPIIHSETSERVEIACHNYPTDQREEFFSHMRSYQKGLLSSLHISADEYAGTLGIDHIKTLRYFFAHHFHTAYWKSDSPDNYGFCIHCDKYVNLPSTCNHRVEPIAGKVAHFLDLSLFTEKLNMLYGEKPRIKVKPAKALKVIDPNRYKSREFMVAMSSNETLDKVASWIDNGLAYWTASQSRNNLRFWPIDTLVTNKNHIWQDAILFPCLLSAAEWMPPKKIIVRGDIETSTADSPVNTLLNRYHADPLRYYLLNRNPTKDFKFKETELIETYNDRLYALSNLVYRISVMSKDYADGVLDAGIRPKQYNWLHPLEFDEYIKDMESLDYDKVLALAHKIVERITQTIIEEQTWNSNTTPKRDIVHILKGLICGIRLILFLLKPFIPGTCQQIENIIQYPKVHSWQYTKYLCMERNNAGMTGEIKIVGQDLSIYPKRRRFICSTETVPSAQSLGV